MNLNWFIVYLLQYQVSNPCVFLLYWILFKLSSTIQNVMIWIVYYGKPPYSNKIHAKKIIYRRKPQRWHLQGDTDFLCLHSEFLEDPEFLITNDSIHLYGLNKNVARFVKVPSEVDVYNSSMFPSYSDAVFQNATHVYEMPTSLAIKLAKRVQMSDIPVLLLGHTGRCGSTVLTNVFYETGRTAVLSNQLIFSPWTGALRDGLVSKSELIPLIRCGLTFILSPRRWLRNKDLCLMKPYSEDIFILPLIKDVFPRFKLLFQYRNGLKTIRSFERINMDYWPSIYYMFPGLIQFMIKEAHRHWMCMDFDRDLKTASRARILMFCAVWAAKMKCFVEMQKQDSSIRATTYEDLIENRGECIARIFAFSGIDPKLNKGGVCALNYDSQRGWINNLKYNYENNLIDKKLQSIANEICDRNGVPRVNEYVQLKGHL